MTRLTAVAHDAVRAVLTPGEVAIDATCGNGHDTALLIACVGDAGRVFGFDVQPVALVRTRELLGEAPNVVLFARDHAELLDAVPAEYRGRVGAVMFNLGYRPGGDRTVTTRTASTLVALRAALELLRPGGVITVLAYPGHPVGREEADVVAALLRGLPEPFQTQEVRSEPDKPGAPRLYLVHNGAGVG